MSKAKPDAFEVARNHIERVKGQTAQIIGADPEELQQRRQNFLDQVACWDDKAKEQAKQNLLKRIGKLEQSDIGGTSELRWKLTVLGMG